MCKAARSAKTRKSVCDEQNKETIKRESVRDVTTPRAFHKLLGLKPLIKLFQSHAVYNGAEICYRDFIQKVKIELLKEKLVNNPPPPPPQEKSICCDNEAASIS